MTVYVLGAKAGRSLLFKVGITRNLKRRHIGIATGCPFETEIIATVEHAEPRNLERQMHDALRRYRLSGEWFSCPLRKIKEAATAMGGKWAAYSERRPNRGCFAATFSGELRYHCARLRLSQQDMARILDVSFEAVSKWQRGKIVPFKITQEGALARLSALRGR